MFTVTESLANALFNWANVLLVVGAVIVLIGTIGAFAMGAAKEQFANERIAENEKETARANEAAAVATQKAEAEHVERLKLEVKLAPRSLTGASATAFSQAVTGSVRGISIDIVVYQAMGNDVVRLSHELAAVLQAAGATASIVTPMGGAGIVQGILVRTASDASPAEKATIVPLVTALQQAGFAADRWQEYPSGEPPANAYNGPVKLANVRILVGSK